MNCHYCGEPLSAFRMRADGDFCSAEHRRKYKRLARSGLARLAEADEALELVRRKDRPMELVSIVNGSTARRAFTPPAAAPPPGMPRLEDLRAARLGTATVSPARREGSPSGTPRLAAMPAWRCGAQARSRLWVLRTAALEVHPNRAGEFLALPPGRGNCDPAIFPPASAEFRAPIPAAGGIAWAAPAPGAPFLPPTIPAMAAARPQVSHRAFQAAGTSVRFPEASSAEPGRLAGAPRFPVLPAAAAAAASARRAGVAFRLPPLVPEPLPLPGIRPRLGR